MVLLGDPCRGALAVVAAVGATGAVSTAALHQEAAGPEDGICPLQLLAQGYGEVARRAAVQLNLLPQQIEIGSSSKTQRGTITIVLCHKTQLIFNRIFGY